MKKELIGVLLACCVLISAVFWPIIARGKTAFPSNLAMSVYVPWRFQPASDFPYGPPNKPMGFDNIRQFFPNRKLLKEELSKWAIPLWNPYIYSGTPFMAAFDTAVWYPLSWIAALVPLIDGWNFLVIIQPLLSLVFMYVFLRSLKFDWLISFLGSCIYAFSGWMVVYWQEILVLEHSFLWIPLALYASVRLWNNVADTTGRILYVFALCNSIFGGFLQMSVYVYVVVVAWSIYLYAVSVERKTHYLHHIFILVVVSLAISSIQLIPSIEAFLQSPRGLSDGISVFENYLVPIRHLLTLVAPDFWGNPGSYNYFGGKAFYFEKMIYLGLIPLVFALYELLSKNSKQNVFWKLTVVVSLSMGFALPTSWLPNYLHIPVLSNSYPSRIFSVYMLASVILACYGMSSYMKKYNRKRMITVLSLITVLFLIAWGVVLSAVCMVKGNTLGIFPCGSFTHILRGMFDSFIGNQAELYSTVSLRNLFIPTSTWIIVCVGILVFSRKKNMLLIILVIIGAFSQSYFIKKYIFFSERRFVYPTVSVIEKISSDSGLNRVWGYGNAYIDKNLPQYYRWYSTDGYGNLSSFRYAKLLSTINNNGIINPIIRRSDTDIIESSEWDLLGSSNPYRLRMMAILGVKYILESKVGELKEKRLMHERFPTDQFVLSWEDNVWRIWKYRHALPRAFFVTDYRIETDDQRIINIMYSKEFAPDKSIVIEKQPKVEQFTGQTNSQVRITEYKLNSMKLEVFSDHDGLVFISDNYYPGWRTFIDGKQVPTLRADYSFRAVAVKKGKHTIIMNYFPNSLLAGAALSFVGVAFLLFYSYKEMRKR